MELIGFDPSEIGTGFDYMFKSGIHHVEFPLEMAATAMDAIRSDPGVLWTEQQNLIIDTQPFIPLPPKTCYWSPVKRQIAEGAKDAVLKHPQWNLLMTTNWKKIKQYQKKPLVRY